MIPSTPNPILVVCVRSRRGQKVDAWTNFITLAWDTGRRQSSNAIMETYMLRISLLVSSWDDKQARRKFLVLKPKTRDESSVFLEILFSCSLLFVIV